jgi:hypothetical protein
MQIGNVEQSHAVAPAPAVERQVSAAVETAGVQRLTARVGLLSLAEAASTSTDMIGLLTALPAAEPSTASSQSCKRPLAVRDVVAKLCANKRSRHVYAVVDAA